MATPDAPCTLLAPAHGGTLPPTTLRFEHLLAYADSVFFVLSLDGTALYVSPSAARVLQADAKALVGRNVLSCVHAADLNHLAAMLRSVRYAPPHSPPATAHLRILRGGSQGSGDQPWIWAEVKLSSDGEYIYCVQRDVTCEKQVEETLRRFLLSTSHDLRTPTHGLQCASQLLAARSGVAADADAMYLLDAVHASTRLLLTTVNNVLELKALEAEAASGRPRRLHKREQLDVRALLADVLATCRVGHAKDIAWLNERDSADLPAVLEGNPERLQQMLLNLAVVALRYAGADGPVTVELRRCKDQEAAVPGSVFLCVTFTAVGRMLTPAEAGAAFEPYESSAGLALVVARSFARAKDGDVLLLCAASGARLEARVRLFTPGAPPAEESDVPSPRAEAAIPRGEAESALPSPNSPAAPPVELTLTARMFEHLIRCSDDLFSTGVIGPEGPIFEWVSCITQERWFGYTREDFIGQNVGSTLHPGDMERYKALVGDTLGRSLAAGGAATSMDITRRLLLRDGSCAYVHTSGCLEGTRWHLVCKLLREQEAKEKAIRRLLLSILPELRTPVQSGLAAAQLLAQRASVLADSEASFLVQAMSASCGLLLGMVSNALSMRSIESGSLEMLVAPFNPREAVVALLQVCRMGCTQQSTIEWVNQQAPLPRLVTADCSFLSQILQNLVTNAAKFENGLGVTVHISCTAGVEAGGGDVAAAADKPATHTLHATVTDRGRGLTLHDCEHVFEAYEASSSANGGGTGLGLFIARTCARRAGGDVSVVSEPGRGAAFTLRFPVHVSPAVAAEWEAATRAWQQRQGGGAAEPACIAVDGGAAPHTPPQPTEVSVRGKRARSPTHAAPPSTLRCLLADDHPLNLLLVKRLLEQHAGLAVETAANGKQAYDQLVAAFDAGRQPHVAVIDMQMPIWSGPDATRAFRAWEKEHRPGVRLPIYCLTANVLDEHRQECEAAGMDFHLPKPLRVHALAELRQRALAYAEQLADEAPPA